MWLACCYLDVGLQTGNIACRCDEWRSHQSWTDKIVRVWQTQVDWGRQFDRFFSVSTLGGESHCDLMWQQKRCAYSSTPRRQSTPQIKQISWRTRATTSEQ